MSQAANKRKSGVGRKILYIFTSLLGVVVILMSVAYGGFYHYYGKMNFIDIEEEGYGYVSEGDFEPDVESDVSGESSAEEETDDGTFDFSDPDITNIMVIGTDSRVRGLWRTASDSMIIVSINKKTHKLFFSSFMRDTLVYIKKGGNHREAGYDKLNAAFAYGNSKMLFETYEENFGIKLDKFVQLDFYSFVTLVDAIGGVDMYLRAKEIKYMNEVYLFELNKPALYDRPYGTDYLPLTSGTFHLNGKQALAYTRVRYVGGDYERTERQRKVIEEILKKVKVMSPSKLSKFVERALKCVSTNLTETDVMNLLVDAPETLNYEFVPTRIPIDNTYHGEMQHGVYVLIVDIKRNARYWYNLVYKDKDISEELYKEIEEEKAQGASSTESETVSEDG
ncbi:MAG: LCP family protein [Clostridia bacterium]|nr:LCP family protein [Clostridia bacterium]